MKRLAVILLAIIALCCAGVFAQKSMTKEESYREYIYPVRPGTEEWGKLISHGDMIDICQLPEEYLTESRTIDLLATVLHYPLLGDTFAWDSDEMGFEMLLRQFNGLSELMTREDLEETLYSIDIDRIEFALKYEYPIAERFLHLLKKMIRPKTETPDSIKATSITDMWKYL
ncbi:MAG: hypothetical protein J5496_08350 [Lachnospiraceae bacterium]|nr:hypothetical protein [Lachnospiraceae bacterium]